PEPVRRYFAAANADEWGDFPDLWHPDAELVAFGRDGLRVRRGREEVLRYYDGLFAPWSEHHDEVTRAIVCGGSVTAEITFTGRTHDGTPVTFDVLDLFDLEDGRIRRLAIWHDVLRVRAMLRG
ncbi:MAG TPA: nuclear transport factor 2 family protein, partial [Acidimicrobiia bacterium]|nr:nuclear transport factor 2 family protein [Acidimicrobiia bacterium]